MAKEIWAAAYEELYDSFGREPTDDEVERRYQERCAALIEELQESEGV